MWVRTLVATALVLAGSVAAADSSEPPERLVVQARTLARAHDCASARVVAAKVAEADEQMYLDAVVGDPEIGPCLANGPVLSPAQVPFREEPVPVGGKSPNTALLLSGGVTLIGAVISTAAFFGANDPLDPNKTLVLIGGGIGLVGPSLGNIYAGDALNVGLGLRVAGLGIFGAMMAHCGPDSCSTSDGTANAMLAAATIVYGAGVITEIALAPRAARRYNREHLQIVPAPMPNGRDGLSPGVVLTGKF